MYLNLEESAEFLGCSPRTLQRMKAKGTISTTIHKSVNCYLKDDLLAIAGDVVKKSKHGKRQKTTDKTPKEPKMSPFEITEEVQQEFDNIVKIVESHTPDLEALDDLVESLLRIRHYKAHYHKEVERDPLNAAATKLLSQTIRDEIAILKALKVSP